MSLPGGIKGAKATVGVIYLARNGADKEEIRKYVTVNYLMKLSGVKHYKEYHIGMYGRKFLSFHKGHRYCVEVAAKECDIVYVIYPCP